MVLVQICDTHVVTTAHMDMTDPIVFNSRSVTVATATPPSNTHSDPLTLALNCLA